MELSLIQKLTIAILPILFAITLHEAAHGYIALLCGDKTAKLSGRLSLNPINHIDIIGSLIVPLATFALGGILFGWAKPVPVNERNFKHPKRDIILVALAGSVANLLMAFGWAIIAKCAALIGSTHGTSGASLAISLMGQFGISINLFILLFNLVPIPPLDGSRILSTLLSPRAAYKYNKIAPYGFFILLGLIFSGVLNVVIGIPFNLLYTLITTLFGL